MGVHNCKYCRILVGLSIPEIVKRNLKSFTIVAFSFTEVACDICWPKDKALCRLIVLRLNTRWLLLLLLCLVLYFVHV
jgi:hypothetical protein